MGMGSLLPTRYIPPPNSQAIRVHQDLWLKLTSGKATGQCSEDTGEEEVPRSGGGGQKKGDGFLLRSNIH